MLKSITIERFKSLTSVSLDLGPLNIFIGTNASGKSNFFDALRVLQGINYGFTVSEVFDSKPQSSTSIIWNGIRGGSKGAISTITGTRPDSGMRLLSTWENNGIFHHEFVMHPAENRFQSERFDLNDDVVFETHRSSERGGTYLADDYMGSESTVYPVDADSTRSYLYKGNGNAPLARDYWANRQYLSFASDMQFLSPDLEILRDYSRHVKVDRMGDHGEDFAALVHAITSNVGIKEAYVSWLRELTPAEITDIVILEGALGEPLFAIKDGSNIFAAPLLSDGTLRFAALTAALFQPDAPAGLMIEEIENGIHPTRLRLLVELLKSRATRGSSQLFVTTHSPVVLAWLKPEDYAHTFLCARSEDGSSQIRPVSSLPHFMEAVQRNPFGDLFAEGWLETAA